jgi:hypothetical protein
MAFLLKDKKLQERKVLPRGSRETNRVKGGTDHGFYVESEGDEL